MRTLFRIAAPLTFAAIAAAAQTTSGENMVNRRGQTRTQDQTQTLDRGRFGSQGAVPSGAAMLHGMLVDAGCQDRSSLNLHLSPTPAPEAAAGGPPRDGVSAYGITVDRGTVNAERADAMRHQVPDMRSRQPDPTCAVTGGTRGFALLLGAGRLLNLDEGGNTMAAQAVQSSGAGRAMLNGNGPGVKPWVAVRGRIVGDRVIVEKLNAD